MEYFIQSICSSEYNVIIDNSYIDLDFAKIRVNNVMNFNPTDRKMFFINSEIYISNYQSLLDNITNITLYYNRKDNKIIKSLYHILSKNILPTLKDKETTKHSKQQNHNNDINLIIKKKNIDSNTSINGMDVQFIMTKIFGYHNKI